MDTKPKYPTFVLYCLDIKTNLAQNNSRNMHVMNFDASTFVCPQRGAVLPLLGSHTCHDVVWDIFVVRLI